MAFPTSPSNNQVHSESGSNRTYVYDSTLGVWDQVKEAQSDISNIAGHISKEVTGFTGIKEADQWRLHTSVSTSGSSYLTLTSNWERNDTVGAGNLLGGGVTESSGVFSFPSTGRGLVEFTARTRAAGDSRPWGEALVECATDGASYTTAAETTWNYYTNSSYASGTTNFLVDVTNIAKYKVRVRMRADNTIEIYGSSSKNYTFFSFLRLGDT